MIIKEKKYWIGVAAFGIPWLLLNVLFYLFVMQPQEQTYKTIHAQFTESNDLVSVARMATFEDTKKRQVALLAELQDRIDHFIVDAEEHDQVIFEVSRLATSFGLSDYAGKTRADVWGVDESEEVKIQRVWMTITFKAPFQQFAAFITAMERHAPAVFVESATIERSSEHPNKHRAKLLISFFTQPETKTDNTALSAMSDKKQEGSSS